MKAGDTILRVNEIDVSRLRHQEALDAIASSGNQFQLLIGRYVNKRIFLSLKIHRFRLLYLVLNRYPAAGKARSSYFQLGRAAPREISIQPSALFCSPQESYINYSNVFFPCSFIYKTLYLFLKSKAIWTF